MANSQGLSFFPSAVTDFAPHEVGEFENQAEGVVSEVVEKDGVETGLSESTSQVLSPSSCLWGR